MKSGSIRLCAKFLYWLSVCCLVAIGSGKSLRGQPNDDPAPDVVAIAKPARLDRDVRKRLQPGLVATFRQTVATETLVDTRHVQRAGLSVPFGQPASSLLEPGPFEFSLTGYLRSSLNGEVRFWQEGQSPIRLTLNGEPIDVGQLETQGSGNREDGGRLAPSRTSLPGAVRLPRGYNRIEIVGSGDGDAELGCRFRLFWSSDKVPPEPIPTSALSFDRQNDDLIAANQLRAGRSLFGTSRCIRCHPPHDLQLPVPGEDIVVADQGVRMPELDFDAPRLTHLGKRLRQTWIEHWIYDPRHLRGPSASQTSMPRTLVQSDLGRQEAVDIAAFLRTPATRSSVVRDQQHRRISASDAKSAELPEASDDPMLVERGLEIYESGGCMACHRFTSPSVADAHDRLSLFYVNAKFRPKQLISFLRMPDRNYHATRMPNFGFNLDQAHAVAAFIRSRSKGTLSPLTADVPDPNRGQDLFAERRCQQCHGSAFPMDDDREKEGDGGDANRRGKNRAIAEILPRTSLFESSSRRGCLAEDQTARGGAPDFGFDAAQRTSLIRFLRQPDTSIRNRTEAELSTRMLLFLRCVACHDRDGVFSPLPDIVEEEGELGLPYERLPSLSLAGEKLRTDWVQRQLRGDLGYRSRPWLRMRMPSFPYYAGLLPQGLAAEHGVADSEPAEAAPDAALVALGQTLSTKEKGFDCVQCHSLDDSFLKLENKANGVSLSRVTDRLRKDYYHRWIRDPVRIDPWTKMPKFIEGDDVQEKFEALWQFMRHQAIETERSE